VGSLFEQREKMMVKSVLSVLASVAELFSCSSYLFADGLCELSPNWQRSWLRFVVDAFDAVGDTISDVSVALHKKARKRC
jgi:hypothetical protein